MFISQTTDFHFANYRFSFGKLQILISQTTDFPIKVNVKKQRRFDRSTVIFKLKSKNFLYALKYTIDYKNANEILTKTLKYLHRNNTSKIFAG